ncbi:molybdenum cofactor guanylyltransferase MobA [Hydrogenophaga sp. BPS33]|uniref:molybdenum cofactor guanylyltransferase MobA n=1 Tax=Hydrogenophaga sp. BPS33 TaxID=2651974 RepID=UPI0013201323|nr:molybdenum cofactor guanylyltransferase MobA [Hydrogenophaga sp. BPS33]QHE84559.1 molybdenum cofactor guanylyltransferase MobA [Hydrogenophaga sp. BPS33]
MNPISRDQITGLVLAGGRGSRMGGVDKGLQNHQGMPLTLHALLRLQPQVGAAMISANRNLSAYEAMGVPVWPDSIDGYAGPLAGLLTGLEHVQTDWLVTVPCDTPNFPTDVVERLATAAAAQDAEIAMAAAPEEGRLRAQPVFCLLRTDLMESLVSYLNAGERKFDRWTAKHRTVEVPFDDAQAFFNANTLAELSQLQR